MTYRRPTVGIVGAGQLARMMAQAAIPLDIRIVLLAADDNDGAAQVVKDVIVGSPDDPAALRALAEASDVLTFDHELVDPVTLSELEAAGHVVWPASASMALAQNKRRQRKELGELGIPIPQWSEIDSVEDAVAFGETHGWPMVLKASQGGYDGRGVWVLDSEAQATSVVSDALAHGTVLLAEELLSLDMEIAVLLARRPTGDIALYPPIETVQQGGICRELRVPAEIPAELAGEALRLGREIAEYVGIVGILAIEFFVSNGELYVNELAPRPHNSGHWSIEGATTSQFEQHLRAVLDLPLGATALIAPGVSTVNLLGEGEALDPRGRLASALQIPGAHAHFYGKQARLGRKIGHVTAVGDSVAEADETAYRMVRALFDEKDGER